MEKIKKEYLKPVVKVIVINSADIIATSLPVYYEEEYNNLEGD